MVPVVNTFASCMSKFKRVDLILSVLTVNKTTTTKYTQKTTKGDRETYGHGGRVCYLVTVVMILWV